MSPEMLDAFEFKKKLRGEVPGPHKIWPNNPKLSKTIVPTGADKPDNGGPQFDRKRA
jgi:4-carboxymuconolactone decarboxylase